MSSKKRKAWKNKQRAERLMALRAALSMEYNGRPPGHLMRLTRARTLAAVEAKRLGFSPEGYTASGRMSSYKLYRYQNMPKLLAAWDIETHDDD